MKLKSFTVVNYRSIIDSRTCYLSPNDGITILAGQNESGKSSLLEALKHYESGTPCLEAYRDEEDFKKRPLVFCTYITEKEEDIFNELLNLSGLEETLKDLLTIDLVASFVKNLHEIQLYRTIGHSADLTHSIHLAYSSEVNSLVNSLKTEEKYKSLTERTFRSQLGASLFRLAPIIVLFDEFFDVLPDKFYLDELESKIKVKGWQAVKNIEKILNADFSKLPSFSDHKATKHQREYESVLTADFNERWRQRIGDETGAIISTTYHQGGVDGRPYLRFSIQTRQGEFLPPEKRSLGFKWFLSFYLHLLAESKQEQNMVLLFDEPGLHLHSNAQYDMLRVFEEISQKNQIIYATHSPYLIDTEKLHRVRLVFNSKEAGTAVEKITTNLSPNKKDAIKPIIDALGMHVAHSFSAAKERNVIVEGISDYYYLTAAKQMLNIEDDFYFLPAMGAPNAHLLMELCMGWGLKWLMIFDEKGSIKDINKIKNKFFSNEKNISSKIHILKGCDGIEDVFTEDDIKLAAPDFTRTTQPLNKDLKAYGDKELIGRFFLDKTQRGEITFDKLSNKAQTHFRQVFEFIEQGFK